jgi:hypothetical protein
MGVAVKDTAHDFVSFPKRKSTWAILSIGGAAALAVHPADDYVQEHIVGNGAARQLLRRSAGGLGARKYRLGPLWGCGLSADT